MSTILCATIVDEVQAFLAAQFNTVVSAVKGSKAADAVLVFEQGFEDPMRLQKYNACLVCPDMYRMNKATRIMDIAIDVIFAIRGNSKAAVQGCMAVYADAFTTLIDADPTLGGKAFEAFAESVEFAGPTPVNALVGVVLARLTVSVNYL